MGDQQKFQNTIRKFLSETDNRTCFTCTQKGPVYIVVPFSIYVCTKCSGLQREFSFRVKGISMSNFTKEEVDDLKKGGNGVARKVWLATWSPEDYPIPEPGDEKKIKAFIRQCFVRGQWKELPPSEPLENLVGKETVEALRIGKGNRKQQEQQQPQHPKQQQQQQPQQQQPQQQQQKQQQTLPKQQEPLFNPFGTPDTTIQKDNTIQKGDDWDPWAPVQNTLPQTTPTNPFGGFGQIQPTPQLPQNPVTPVTFTPYPTNEPKQSAVDLHSLFVTPQLTGNTTTPNIINPIPHLNTPNGIPLNTQPPLGPPLQTAVHYQFPVQPVVFMPQSNPWAPTGVPPGIYPQGITPQQTTTGPDAFSGLLVGFGSK